MPQKKQTYDVGILGWWYGKNYGSILTYFGLNRAITKLGYDVLMVHEALGYNNWRVKWPDSILSMKFAKRMGYNVTKQVHFSKLGALNADVKTFMVGSDQLWNPRIGRVNDDLFLDFVDSTNRRVAYATSFGNRDTKKFSEDFVSKHAPNLQKFDAISVREQYGVDTAREVFDVDATSVVDPVFLLPTTEYDQLAEQANIVLPEDYLAVFYLDPTEDKMRVAQAIADKLGLEKVVVIPNPDGGRKLTQQLFEGERFEILSEDAPENFLYTYKHARYVLTDSFHGTAFALIFEKPFSSIYNTKRGADRFKNLLNGMKFGESRRVYETDDLEKIRANRNVSTEIDFAAARKTIEAERKISQQWLEAALAGQAKKEAGPVPLGSRDLVGTLKKKIRTISQSLPVSAGAPSGIDPECFTSSGKAWTITTTRSGVRLKVASDAAVPGNQVCYNLPQTLKKGHTYRVSMNWAVRTTAPSVNLHIRNSQTGKFAVIGSVLGKGQSGSFRTDSVEFSVKSDGNNQIMLGAVHFTGRNAGADIAGIAVKEVATAPSASPDGRKKTAPSGKPAPTKEQLAVPGGIPNREEMILNIRKDPIVQQWREKIRETIPGLTHYVGRELKEYVWNKVGGPADILAIPENISEMQSLIRLAHDSEIPCTVLGRGSNVIVRDGGIRGIALLTTGLKGFKLDGSLFTVGAGASLIESTFYLLDHGKSGLEWAAGIPGTVGGAVFMNAGTNHGDIRSSFVSAKVMDGTGEIFVLGKKDITWGKRYTSIQDHASWIVLETTFEVEEGQDISMARSMVGTVQIRENHFPLEYPNHGSTFKWWRAPRLIKQAGLSGKRIGGVEISKKQPGFFVNVDQATASDYEALINYAIANVYEFSGFLLEPEVEIIGDRPYRLPLYTKDKYNIKED